MDGPRSDPQSPRSRRRFAGISSCVAFLGFVALLTMAGCARDGANGGAAVHVAAAASLTDALGAAAAEFGRARGVTVSCEFGATSTLARQLEAGAAADLFVAADEAWMDELAQHGTVDPASRQDVAANRLVLIAPATKPFRFDFAARAAPLASAFTGPLALADPSHVPAGRYAQQALERHGDWAALATRVVAAADVRAALKLVQAGDAAAGIVYATDVRADDPQVTVVARIPTELHAPIRYPAALVKTDDGTRRAAAAEFLRWLVDPNGGQVVLSRHGFAPPTRQ